MDSNCKRKEKNSLRYEYRCAFSCVGIFLCVCVCVCLCMFVVVSDILEISIHLLSAEAREICWSIFRLNKIQEIQHTIWNLYSIHIFLWCVVVVVLFVDEHSNIFGSKGKSKIVSQIHLAFTRNQIGVSGSGIFLFWCWLWTTFFSSILHSVPSFMFIKLIHFHSVASLSKPKTPTTIFSQLNTHTYFLRSRQYFGSSNNSKISLSKLN